MICSSKRLKTPKLVKLLIEAEQTIATVSPSTTSGGGFCMSRISMLSSMYTLTSAFPTPWLFSAIQSNTPGELGDKVMKAFCVNELTLSSSSLLTFCRSWQFFSSGKLLPLTRLQIWNEHDTTDSGWPEMFNCIVGSTPYFTIWSLEKIVGFSV